MMMGAICFAVSLRTLAGSSSGPVGLFWFRFSSCFITPSMTISRRGMLGSVEGAIWGMGCFSWINTELN